MAYLPLVIRDHPKCACGAAPSCSRRELRDACGLFRKFHRYSPPRALRVPCRRVLPKVMVGLGRLKAVVYTSDKDTPGRPRTFIHFMEDRPWLTSDPGGRQLYVIGGSYRITPRGIEG